MQSKSMLIRKITIAVVLGVLMSINETVSGTSSNVDIKVAEKSQLSAESQALQSQIDALLENIDNIPAGTENNFANIEKLVEIAKKDNSGAAESIFQKTVAIIQNPACRISQRWMCCYVVSRIGDERGVSVLAKVLTEEPDTTIRGVAACALGEFGSQEAHAVLEKAAGNEKDTEVLGWIKKSLASTMTENQDSPTDNQNPVEDASISPMPTNIQPPQQLMLDQPTNMDFREPGESNIPKGWGDKPITHYEYGLDNKEKRAEKPSAYIKSTGPVSKDEVACLSQCIKANQYRGKQIKLSGFKKIKDVTGAGAGVSLCVMVEGEQSAFDSTMMHKEPTTGTIPWKQFQIVLDVPQNATTILYGPTLCGTGQIWVNDFKLEIVGKSKKVPSARTQKPRK